MYVCMHVWTYIIYIYNMYIMYPPFQDTAILGSSSHPGHRPCYGQHLQPPGKGGEKPWWIGPI